MPNLGTVENHKERMSQPDKARYKKDFIYRAVSQADTSTSQASSFGWPLTLALVLPFLLAIGAWVAQWVLRFPPGSARESLTALGLVVGLLSEIIPTAIAITKLARNPLLRTPTNIVVTSLAALLLVPAILLCVALVAGW